MSKTTAANYSSQKYKIQVFALYFRSLIMNLKASEDRSDFGVTEN